MGGRLCAAVLVGWVFLAGALAQGQTYDLGNGMLLMVQGSGPDQPAGSLDSIVSSLSASAMTLPDVPTSRWTYGCSATSAGMMFGYYDRHGYSNMYAGPANGGLAPTYDLGASCSIIATKQGFDGLATRGHVDDYWIATNSAGPDPWQNNWAEHSWAACTADYMGTNQWKWDYYSGIPGIDSNRDGATSLFSYSGGTPLYDYIPPAYYGLPRTELCHGMRLFAESRGYTVLTNYTQVIDAWASGGFSFAQYQAEIDNGLPVMLQLDGHTIMGVGYDASSQTVYLHDTWDNNVHSMIWGGSYSGMTFRAVTVVHLAPVPEPATLALLAGGMVVLISRRSSRGRA